MVLLFNSTIFACDIPQSCRIKNQPPGYCCWACLETLGRYHGIEGLYDLLESRKEEKDLVINDWFGNATTYPRNLGYDFTVRNKLNDLKVKYWMQDAGGINRTLLKYAGSHGCVVGVKEGALKGVKTTHAIVILEYDEEKVEYFDPNSPSTTWVATRKWFDHWWTGMIIIVQNSKR